MLGRARALVAAANADAVNTYVVLTARTINPESRDRRPRRL